MMTCAARIRDLQPIVAVCEAAQVDPIDFGLVTDMDAIRQDVDASGAAERAVREGGDRRSCQAASGPNMSGLACTNWSLASHTEPSWTMRPERS